MSYWTVSTPDMGTRSLRSDTTPERQFARLLKNKKYGQYVEIRDDGYGRTQMLVRRPNHPEYAAIYEELPAPGGLARYSTHRKGQGSRREDNQGDIEFLKALSFKVKETHTIKYYIDTIRGILEPFMGVTLDTAVPSGESRRFHLGYGKFNVSVEVLEEVEYE
jgi:hypothetical protein